MPAALVRVAVLSPPYSTLTYSLPEHFPAAAFFIGQRAAAPLGRGLRLGVITASGKAEDVAEGFGIKPLLWPLDKNPLISPSYLNLALQLAARHTESPGRVLASLLPASLRSARVRLRFFGDGKARELSLSALAGLEARELAHCAALWQEGLATTVRAGLSPLDAEVCILTADPPWPVRPAAKAQTALLEYLLEHGLVTRRRLNEALGRDAGATLTLLADRGLVRIGPADEETEAGELPPPVQSPEPQSGSGAPGAAFSLSLEQLTALEALDSALSAGQAHSSLLFGITGSGKTAVYLELARKALALGRSVMLLAPEVALAHKLWQDVSAALPGLYPSGCRPLLYHGYQAQAQRERIFRELAEEGASAREASPRLVVGTRSALLLPLKNVGLIVLDEEHDSSFKQDEGFIYQAKEVAWYRALQDKALLLLGSATPDIKSFHAASMGLIPMQVLRERVGGGSLPAVELVPLAGRAAKAAANEPLAPQSLAALNETVARGEQAIIMLNRRGYAPVMYCLACNAVAKCPHCDIALAYHKGRERLLCHYCGFAAPFPSPCAACQGLHFLPMGEGTEKLEESLGPLLPPGTGILRLDRDSARRPGRMEAILAAFARKEAQVLVGTQMLSKGHHFPDVTLAIVADADLGLNLPAALFNCRVAMC
ncbi:primosomal protein N' [Desulfovibrio sp. OttesenSCG-928-G11]|nr:primosomal protein N' [Desulfovibrio sp. OttesenSCG-928-G11]